MTTDEKRTARVPTHRQLHLINLSISGLEAGGFLIKRQDGKVHLEGLTMSDVIHRLEVDLEGAGVPMQGGLSPATVRTQVKAVMDLPLRAPREKGASGALQERLIALLISKGVFTREEWDGEV